MSLCKIFEILTVASEMTIDTVFEMGLHEFLKDFITSNSAISVAIADDYRFTG